MFTSLDLLIVVFMILAAVTLLSLCLMFFLKNKTAKRVFFYIATALVLYVSWVGFRIGIGGLFYGQIIMGIITANLGLSALFLDIFGKGSNRLFLIARIVSVASLVLAFVNAIF